MSKIIQWLKDPFLLFSIFVHKFIKGKAHFLSDKCYLSLLYRASFRKKLDWKNPQTFNEKLQWQKLYDRNPLYSLLVDKYEVKKYVEEQIGKEYIIPTIGVWYKFEDIDFSMLPNQFVLKCTHDSGGLVIVRDKSKLDIEAARKKINKSLKNNFYWPSREWPYKKVKPRIIAEQYMEDEETGELRDYKFFCFNGSPKYLFIASDRSKGNSEVKFDYFDMEFNRLPMRQAAHPNSTYDIKRPITFDLMKSLAKKLSENLTQVRIDLYEINGKVFFGEFTFFHHGGFVPFIPESYDLEWGQQIKLPISKQE